MGFSRFLSTLALVSLGFSSFDLVAARPYGHGHKEHKTFTKTIRSTYTVTESTPAPAVHTTVTETSPNVVPTETTTSTTPKGTPLPSSSSSKYPAQSYSLVKEFCSGGTTFFDQFNFFTGDDPTHGFVDYVDRSTAQSNNMIGVSNGTVYLAPDSVNVAPGGRKSVRLESIDTFTEVLLIADFSHLPEAVCGSWPAFWTSNLNNWPSGGEIDIIEGVNNDVNNHLALHTTSGLVITPDDQTGTFETLNCDVNAAGQAANAGCGGRATVAASYGAGFNQAGGGVYAMDWRAEGIRVWHFPRGSVPSDILAGAPTTADWGVPDFDFSSSASGAVASHFDEHQIIFDMTFCGDWAGNVFGSCGCAGTCTDFVANNPSAFTEHFFGINSLSVYKAS